MNWVDIVILVLVIGLGFMGWRNGVIRLIFTLVGGIVGLVLAGQLFDDLAPIVPIGDKEGVQQLIAFGAIFLAVLIGAWIAARVVKAVLTILLLGWVDSLVGLAIGVLVGAIAATAFVSAAGIVPSDSVKDAVTESQLAEPLSDNLGFVRGFLPEEFDSVGDLLDQGASLLGQGADLLGQVEKLESLIEEGQGLLDAAGGDFVIGWQGLDDYVDANMIVVFVPETDGKAPGPLDIKVKPGGVALLSLTDEIDGDESYDVYWYADGNDNGSCDDSDVDAKGHISAPSAVSEVGVSYLSGIATDGVCDHF